MNTNFKEIIHSAGEIFTPLMKDITKAIPIIIGVYSFKPLINALLSRIFNDFFKKNNSIFIKILKKIFK